MNGASRRSKQATWSDMTLLAGEMSIIRQLFLIWANSLYIWITTGSIRPFGACLIWQIIDRPPARPGNMWCVWLSVHESSTLLSLLTTTTTPVLAFYSKCSGQILWPRLYKWDSLHSRRFVRRWTETKRSVALEEALLRYDISKYKYTSYLYVTTCMWSWEWNVRQIYISMFDGPFSFRTFLLIVKHNMLHMVKQWNLIYNHQVHQNMVNVCNSGGFMYRHFTRQKKL